METNNKLRDALTESRNLLHRLANLTSAGEEHWAMAKVRAEEIVNITSEKIPAMIMQISAALAEPVRNYEVGTAGEQYRRFREYCGGRCTTKCKVYEKGIALGIVNENNYYKADCRFVWEQMPYEGGAK